MVPFLEWFVEEKGNLEDAETAVRGVHSSTSAIQFNVAADTNLAAVNATYDDARILRTDRLATAEAFFNRCGPLALVIGRFVPIVRTYVPVAAGTAQMPYRNFVIWNVGGALAWVGSMVLIGALLGHIPGITHSIDGIILLILGISMLPVAISATTSYIKKRRAT